jgi:hypothetical protein
VEASFHLDGKQVQHPLETNLKASAWAILTAIERSRMAVMNVKGQLAEYASGTGGVRLRPVQRPNPC